MLIITDMPSLDRALRTLGNPWLRRMLALRGNQLLDTESGPFVVVEPGDTLSAIEQAAGVPIATNLVDGAVWPDPDFVPSWEWCRADHGWHEICYILSDGGGGAIIFVPDRDGIDTALLALVRTFTDHEA